MVDGHPYVCDPAKHDGMSAVVRLRFVHGRAYPPVVESEDGF
jgi:hypothetical protein